MRAYTSGFTVKSVSVVMPKVWPSGAAFTTTSAPTLPPAPARFSTTNGCLSESCSFSFISRVTSSEGPPGGKVISMRTGFTGHACAAVVQRAARANARNFTG